jgi:FixJ family two-component response regulator
MLSVQSERAVQRPVVLLVEDDDAVRRSLQLLLVSRGYDVRAFDSGAALASMPDALGADCLIVDLRIPGGDGVMLLETMQAAGWVSPSVLISGHLTDADTTRAHMAGFDAVLAKPIGEHVLVTLLDRLTDADGAARH